MKVEKTTLWLHRPVVDEIIALVGKQGLSEFMREAAKRELARRAKLKPEKGAAEGSE
jgi:metal-responsive CopG/Arc/MetJ family transcriptional regulator